MPVASCETPKGGAYCNGECGKISVYDKKLNKVSVLIEGQHEATVLDIHQFHHDFCPGFAVTVYNAQSKTLCHDYSIAEARNLQKEDFRFYYTAISRAQKF